MSIELLKRLEWGGVQRIKVLRQNIKKLFKTKGICKIISSAIKREFGLEIKIGMRQGKEHWWNVFSDGFILDASADQFGDDPVIVVNPESEKAALYEI